MALDSKGFPPSREGVKEKVLKEILHFLDGRIGNSLKEKGPKLVHVEVADGDEGSPEEEAAESPEEAAAEGDAPVEGDDDARKLMELAKRRK